MTERERVLLRAVASLLDVVQELSQGLAAGQRPDTDWADVVVSSFDSHRRELASGVVEEDDDA